MLVWRSAMLFLLLFFCLSYLWFIFLFYSYMLFITYMFSFFLVKSFPLLLLFYVLVREGGDIGLLITLVPKHFYWTLICWLQTTRVQTFKPMTLIYIRNSLIYHHLVCRSIYSPLSYPLRSLFTTQLANNDTIGTGSGNPSAPPASKSQSNLKPNYQLKFTLAGHNKVILWVFI